MVKVKAHTRGVKYIKVALYKYDNAPESTKEKILEKMRARAAEEEVPFLSESLQDSCIELLKKTPGVKDPVGIEVHYSLGYSQGDGVMFEGKVTYKKAAFHISHNGNYYHSRSADFELSQYNDKYTDELTEKEKAAADKAIKEFKEGVYQRICKELEKIGYKEIEYQQSDEALKDTIEANDWWFDINGDIKG